MYSFYLLSKHSANMKIIIYNHYQKNFQFYEM